MSLLALFCPSLYPTCPPRDFIVSELGKKCSLDKLPDTPVHTTHIIRSIDMECPCVVTGFQDKGRHPSLTYEASILISVVTLSRS